MCVYVIWFGVGVKCKKCNKCVLAEFTERKRVLKRFHMCFNQAIFGQMEKSKREFQGLNANT